MVETINKMSPTSLKVTKKEIEIGKNMSLSDCLEMEYRLACSCLNKNSDFAEGFKNLYKILTQMNSY